MCQLRCSSRRYFVTRATWVANQGEKGSCDQQSLHEMGEGLRLEKGPKGWAGFTGKEQEEWVRGWTMACAEHIHNRGFVLGSSRRKYWKVFQGRGCGWTSMLSWNFFPILVNSDDSMLTTLWTDASSVPSIAGDIRDRKVTEAQCLPARRLQSSGSCWQDPEQRTVMWVMAVTEVEGSSWESPDNQITVFTWWS